MCEKQGPCFPTLSLRIEREPERKLISGWVPGGSRWELCSFILTPLQDLRWQRPETSINWGHRAFCPQSSLRGLVWPSRWASVCRGAAWEGHRSLVQSVARPAGALSSGLPEKHGGISASKILHARSFCVYSSEDSVLLRYWFFDHIYPRVLPAISLTQIQILQCCIDLGYLPSVLIPLWLYFLL